MAMADRSWTARGFLLADWEVLPRHGTVRPCADPLAAPIQLEPRVMAVLVCLARHAGQVVTRDEFIAEVWSGRVVSDEALSRCVSLLRQVLNDDTREPRFIRTVARVGYTGAMGWGNTSRRRGMSRARCRAFTTLIAIA
jgi:DNA-binding winged helix-turn-helix (wHTH) protein